MEADRIQVRQLSIRWSGPAPPRHRMNCSSTLAELSSPRRSAQKSAHDNHHQRRARTCTTAHAHAPSGTIDVLPFCSHSTCLFSGVNGAHAAARFSQRKAGHTREEGRIHTSRVELGYEAQVKVKQCVAERELRGRWHAKQQLQLRAVRHCAPRSVSLPTA
jgi:hypothetical protein